MYLVDACVLIALKDARQHKPPWVLDLFEDQPESLQVSAITIWEIEIKVARRPTLLTPFWEPDHPSLAAQLTASGMTLVSFTAAAATRAARLPMHHKDPFDRGLIATAQHLDMPILSFDRMLTLYAGVDVCWERPPGA
jgi:PIN domain nuclease of toxin-antitoxin system